MVLQTFFSWQVLKNAVRIKEIAVVYLFTTILQCRRFLWARNLLAKATIKLMLKLPEQRGKWGKLKSTLPNLPRYTIFHCNKSKMAATTILRTRTRFRSPKIRLHCRLHNCVRQELLTSKCVSCNTYTDGLLLKTVPFPDLVVIGEERSELVWSKILCVICMESESARNKLLVTRCCGQFAHIYCLALPIYARLKTMLTRYKRRGFIAKTVLCVVVLLRKKPGQEAPLDHLIVQL